MVGWIDGVKAGNLFEMEIGLLLLENIQLGNVCDNNFAPCVLC